MFSDSPVNAESWRKKGPPKIQNGRAVSPRKPRRRVRSRDVQQSANKYFNPSLLAVCLAGLLDKNEIQQTFYLYVMGIDQFAAEVRK